MSAKFASYVLRELRILEHLGNHPHIVKVIEALSDPLHYYIVLGTQDLYKVPIIFLQSY